MKVRIGRRLVGVRGLSPGFVALAFLVQLHGCGGPDDGQVGVAPADAGSSLFPQESSADSGLGESAGSGPALGDVKYLVNDFCATMGSVVANYPLETWLNPLPSERTSPPKCDMWDQPASGARGIVGEWEISLVNPSIENENLRHTAGFAIYLTYIPACSADLLAAEGPPQSEHDWCTAGQMADYFGPTNERATPGGIRYQVVTQSTADGSGDIEVFVGDYFFELEAYSSNGVDESTDRPVKMPGTADGVEPDYQMFVDDLVDSLFIQG